MQTTYLDNASSSHPKPEEVYQAVSDAVRLGGSPGAREGAAPHLARIVDQCRTEAAALLGVASPRRIVFTHNGTDALNLAIKGCLDEGDHVVTTLLERNAVARPLTHMQMKGRISLTRIEANGDGRVDPDALEAAVRHRTRLVVLTHGCGALGTVQPVEEIARRLAARKVPLLVDASHTAGQVPIDVDGWGIGMLATSGHRGLFGPSGTGILALGEGIQLRPLREGDTGGDPKLTLQPLELPWALEAGVPNFAGLAGLAAGIRYVRAQGVEAIREYQTTLIKRFIGAIGLDERFHLYAARGDLPRTGTAVFRLNGFPPEQLAVILERAYGIEVAAGYHEVPAAHPLMKTDDGGTVRVSVGRFNTETDIDRTVAALREVADSGVERALRGIQDAGAAPAGAARPA